MALQKTFADLAADAKTRIREITPEEVAAKLKDAPPAAGATNVDANSTEHGWVLIDVRENDEFRAGHLPGARGIGRGVLEYHIADEVPDTQTEIVLYCRGGNRSALAADSLRRMGYSNVLSMSGGYREWTQSAERPTSQEGEPIRH